MEKEVSINDLWYKYCIELGIGYKTEPHWENREQLEYNKQFFINWKKSKGIV